MVETNRYPKLKLAFIDAVFSWENVFFLISSPNIVKKLMEFRLEKLP